jgi:hypothetical protein
MLAAGKVGAMTVGREAMADGSSSRDAFRRQAAACLKLGSPFTALVCELLAQRLTQHSRFGRRVLRWRGDPVSDALALRAAGGLHALARSGECFALRDSYPPNRVGEDGLVQALEVAIRDHDAFLNDYLDAAPQTNEVKRSAVLIGGCLTIAAETGLPLAICEIGASAGLNLALDRYRYVLGTGAWGDPQAKVVIRCEWEGVAPPLEAPLAVVSRRGCDLNPLDAASERDRERLLSYIWADQAERLAMTAQALSEAASAPWRVERADAAAWTEERLAEAAPHRVARVLAHTIMWQYLTEDTKRRVEGAVRAAGARAEASRPLAWLRMELDGDDNSAGVYLATWPGGRQRMLGRADFHGRWVRWGGLKFVDNNGSARWCATRT